MKKENNITVNNLLYSILLLVFGIILIVKRSTTLIGIASKVIGSVIVIIGIVSILMYVYMKGKLGNYSPNKLFYGLILLFFGSTLIVYSEVLSFTIRTVIGLWILISGINKIILSIYSRKYDYTGFLIYLITSIIMIFIGIFLVSGYIDWLVGWLIVIYSVIEIINYIYYVVKGKNYIKYESKRDNSNLKKNKLKNKGKVVEAVIEEDK